LVLVLLLLSALDGACGERAHPRRRARARARALGDSCLFRSLSRAAPRPSDLARALG
jgi:hypothetical protein